MENIEKQNTKEKTNKSIALSARNSDSQQEEHSCFSYELTKKIHFLDG